MFEGLNGYFLVKGFPDQRSLGSVQNQGKNCAKEKEKVQKTPLIV
jgi:hypothetical protein